MYWFACNVAMFIVSDIIQGTGFAGNMFMVWNITLRSVYMISVYDCGGISFRYWVMFLVCGISFSVLGFHAVCYHAGYPQCAVSVSMGCAPFFC